MKNIETDNIQFISQFDKTERKNLQNADKIDARSNLLLKENKKKNKLIFKNRFNDVSTNDLEVKLEGLLEKPEDAKREKHIKELYFKLIEKYSKNNNLDNTVKNLHLLYQLNSKDVNILRIIRKTCKKHALLSTLEEFERDNDSIKKSFWSKIALIDVLLRRYEKDNLVNSTEIENLLATASALKNRPNHYFEINSRKTKLSIYSGNENLAKSDLMNFADSISGISSAHYINRFNDICIRYFLKFNNSKLALETIAIALKETNKIPENEILKKIFEINEGKDINAKPVHQQRLSLLKNKLMTIQLD